MSTDGKFGGGVDPVASIGEADSIEEKESGPGMFASLMAKV